jgi:hypothetical protein
MFLLAEGLVLVCLMLQLLAFYHVGRFAPPQLLKPCSAYMCHASHQ